MMAGTETPSRVGFVGLGTMGQALALRLVDQGIPLVAYNRSPERVRPLEEKGALVAGSPREAAQRASSGVVFVATVDGKTQRRTILGRSGVARGLPAGGVVVGLATIAPEESRALAKEVAARGLRYVEAPMGGSAEQATSGQVAFYVGGEAEDLARVVPLLEKMGRRVFVMGPVGRASAMKLALNALTVGYVALAGEALALGERHGLTREQQLDVFLDGAGRSVMLERKRGAILARSYPPAFGLPLALKDEKLIVGTARKAGLSLGMSRESLRLLKRALAQGRGKEDFAAVVEVLSPGAPATTAGPGGAPAASDPTTAPPKGRDGAGDPGSPSAP
jgi:3-hydroxyisobutyrate dehydrogenase-like beta-hydroxyacid dehydrogenase